VGPNHSFCPETTTMIIASKPSRRYGATFAVTATRSAEAVRAPRNDAWPVEAHAEGLTE